MCMFGKNRRMNDVRCALCFALLLALSACWSRKELPEDQATSAFLKAFSTLQGGDVEGYMQYVDFGGEMDSLQRSVLCRLLTQHQDLRVRQKGELLGIEAVDAQMQGDTVCTVFCQLTFADSTAELVSQKMVRVGEDWKVRLRN